MKNIKKVLVTGGAGFIGSHLVERLLKEGYKVTVLDNFSTGRKENLNSVVKNKLLQLYEVDLASSEREIRRYFQDVDFVFHLAALADIVPSIVKPLDYHHANVDGTVNVLEAGRRANIKKFIYAASSSCYGIPDIYPTPETAPICPQYPYALTKYLGEMYTLHFGKVYKLPVVSLRFFNVFGPRSRTSGTYGAVFGTFLAQKLAGLPFTVVGDGNQKRDFVFVTDVVSAMIAALKPQAANEIFNVGSGHPQSINKLVELLHGQAVHIAKRPAEPDCTWADISKIKRILQWQPEVSFQEGVKIMLKNINYWKNAPAWTPEMINKETHDWFKYLK